MLHKPHFRMMGSTRSRREWADAVRYGVREVQGFFAAVQGASHDAAIHAVHSLAPQARSDAVSLQHAADQWAVSTGAPESADVLAVMRDVGNLRTYCEQVLVQVYMRGPGPAAATLRAAAPYKVQQCRSVAQRVRTMFVDATGTRSDCSSGDSDTETSDSNNQSQQLPEAVFILK